MYGYRGWLMFCAVLVENDLGEGTFGADACSHPLGGDRLQSHRDYFCQITQVAVQPLELSGAPSAILEVVGK